MKSWLVHMIFKNIKTTVGGQLLGIIGAHATGGMTTADGGPNWWGLAAYAVGAIFGIVSKDGDVSGAHAPSN